MKLQLPQIIYLILVFVGLLVAANKHGKSQPAYDFWSTLISVILNSILFYFGGFFTY